MSHSYAAILAQNLDTCLDATNFSLGNKRTGKVRDIYEFTDFLAIVTTDRQSAFDKVLGKVPYKGQVLNLSSNWWFAQTAHIVPNHVLTTPAPNLLIAKKCQPFPVEFIVRSYITGTSKTSMWTHYQAGARDYCGYKLPENLKKNQKLPDVILTPTTKSDTGDNLISKQDIIVQGLMTKQEYAYIYEIALELFRYSAAIALKQGLILVDTKYEFGKDAAGNIMLIDELHTPDSSRYWLAASHEALIAQGEEPIQLDKEILRRYYAEHFDIRNTKILPAPPPELVIKLASAYIEFYETLTASKFEFTPYSEVYHAQLQHAVFDYRESLAMLA